MSERMGLPPCWVSFRPSELSLEATRPRRLAMSTTDTKLEVVVIPVSDVGRAKEFYGKLGWRLDADFPFDNGFRVVQFTPPGSGCSVQFGTNITSAEPGSAQGLYLVVSDIGAARDYDVSTNRSRRFDLRQ